MKHNDRFITVKLWNDNGDVDLFKGQKVTFMNLRTDWYWNNVIRTIFSYNQWKSLKTMLLALRRLNTIHLIMFRKINFHRHAFLSQNNVFRTIFTSFLKNDCDVMLKSVSCLKLQLLI